MTNSLIGDALQVTAVAIEGSSSSSSYDRLDLIEYPLAVTSTYEVDNKAFRFDALIDQGLRHANSKADGSSTVQYTDAAATYNRSNSPERIVFVQEGTSAQNTSLSVLGASCIEKIFEPQKAT